MSVTKLLLFSGLFQTVHTHAFSQSLPKLILGWSAYRVLDALHGLGHGVSSASL